MYDEIAGGGSLFELCLARKGSRAKKFLILWKRQL
jgi:hypothetical protein